MHDFEERYPYAYAAELDAFADCARTGAPPRVTARDAAGNRESNRIELPGLNQCE